MTSLTLTLSPELLERLRSHAQWTRSLALRLVGDPDEAEDIVQESWIAAARRPPEDPSRAWLGTVVRNLVRDRTKLRHRAERRAEVAEDLRGAETPTAEALVAEAEAHGRLMARVLELDEPFRETVLLRYFHGLSSAEIARAQGVPDGTVRWRLKRALDELRTRLDADAGGDRESWRRALLPLLPASQQLAPRPSPAPVPASPKTAGNVLYGAAVALIVAGVTTVVVLGRRTDAGGTGDAALVSPPGEPAAAGVRSPGFGVWAAGTPEANGALEVEVVDGNGRPLPAAMVLVVRASTGASGDRSRRVLASGATDAAGRWTRASLAAGDHVVTASATTHAGQAALLTVSPGERARIRITMVPAETTFSGTVADASGGPIPGALIELTGVAGLSVAAPVLPPTTVGRTISGAAGEFVLAMRPGSYNVRTHADGYASRSGTLTLFGHESQQIVLAGAGAIAGVVEDLRGRPVAGATVVADYEGGGHGQSSQRAQTSDDGRFQMENLAPGELRLSAQKGNLSGRLDGTVALQISQRLDGLRIRLEPARRLAGVVRGADGRALRNAHVWWKRDGSDPEHRYDRDGDANTDESGRFVLEGLPASAITLYADEMDHAGSPAITVDLASGDRDDLEIRLARGVRIQGRVLSPDGKGVAGAHVFLEMRAPGEPASRRGRLTPLLGRHRVTTSRDGTFATAALGPGILRVRAEHLGQGTVRSDPLPIGAGPNPEVVLRFPAPAFVEGRVIGEEGRPATGAHVAWYGDGGPQGLQAPETTVGRDGSFRLGPLPPGAGTLEASWPDLSWTRITVTAADGRVPVQRHRTALSLAQGERRRGVDLVLRQRDRAIEGVVVNARGEPVDGAAVQVAPDSSTDDWVSTIAVRKAISAPDGRFLLDGLPSGAYVVTVSHEDHPETQMHAVRAGRRDLRVRLATGARVSGKVVGSGGTPVEAFTVVAVAAPPAGRFTYSVGTEEGVRRSLRAPDGVFELGPLAAGRHEIYVLSSDGRAGTAGWIDLREGERRAGVLVVVKPTVALRGRVVNGADGAGADGVSIAVSGREGRVHATTDREGRFRIAGLVPGKTIVLVIYVDGDAAGSPSRDVVQQVALPEEGVLDLDPFPGPPAPRR